MRKRQPLGELQLEILEFLCEQGPKTVREAAEHFAETKGYARTTVLTVMEKLREKGHLRRRKVKAGYRYSAKVGRAELLETLVRDFVENSLGGSLTPFVAYLTREAELSDEEFRKLEELVLELRKQKKGERR